MENQRLANKVKKWKTISGALFGILILNLIVNTIKPTSSKIVLTLIQPYVIAMAIMAIVTGAIFATLGLRTISRNAIFGGVLVLVGVCINILRC